MTEFPRFVVDLPARCAHWLDPAGTSVCGNLAVASRPGVRLIADRFFCAAHRVDSDVEIPADRVVRRVRVAALIDFAAVVPSAGLGQTEAVKRLQDAVTAAGGVLNVLEVSSTVGRVGAERGQGRANASGNGPEPDSLRH